jgi:hypothetical protein
MLSILESIETAVMENDDEHAEIFFKGVFFGISAAAAGIDRLDADKVFKETTGKDLNELLRH